MADARGRARALAQGRIAFGVAALVAPRLATRPWIGAAADEPGTQALARALGVRDVLLGGLALHVVDRPGVAQRTYATVAIADAVDCLATALAARRGIPRAGAVLSMAVAGAGALGGLAVSRELPAATPADSSA
jgi:hypothetical protein